MSRRHLFTIPEWYYKFDTGSAISVTDTGTIRITPHTWASQWLWHAMVRDNLGGTTPHFLVAKTGRYGQPTANEGFAFWSQSLDTENWYPFDNQVIGASDLEFYNNYPFPNGKVYISSLPLYPFSRVQRKFNEWLTKDTRFTKLSIGQSTRRAGYDGRTVPALPYLGMKITNNSGFTKNKMFLSAYVHPSETQGPWQLEGAIEWLISGNPLAEFLLNWTEFFIYPCINPQGVVAGYFRTFPEDSTKDDNRVWDTTGSYEHVDALKTSFSTETGGSAELAIDFHGSVAYASNYIDSEDHTASLYAIALTKMKALEAPDAYSYSDMTYTSMITYLWRHTYSAFTWTSEGQWNKTQPVSRMKSLGQRALQVTQSMTAEKQFANGPTPGSRDFAGSPPGDRIDWAAVLNPKAAALTVSAWIKCTSNTGNRYLLVAHDSGDTTFGFVWNLAAASQLCIVRNRTSQTSWIHTVESAFVLETWYHILSTSDGGYEVTSVKHYINNVEQTVSYGLTGSGTETEHTGSWSIGGRKYDDTRNFHGKIAELGYWNRVLTTDERQKLTFGYAPSLISSGLQFYFSGATSSLVADPPNSTGTADGTTHVTGVGNGPGIIYA